MNDFIIPVVIFTTENNSVAGEYRIAQENPSLYREKLHPEAAEIALKQEKEALQQAKLIL